MFTFKHSRFQVTALVSQPAWNHRIEVGLGDSVDRTKSIGFLLPKPLKVLGPMFHHVAESLEAHGSSLTSRIEVGTRFIGANTLMNTEKHFVTTGTHIYTSFQN